MEKNRNQDEHKHPATVADALDALQNRILSTEWLAELRDSRGGVVMLFHHGLGTYIRNSLGLWGQNDGLLSELGGEPDEASSTLLVLLRERLRGRPEPSEEDIYRLKYFDDLDEERSSHPDVPIALESKYSEDAIDLANRFPEGAYGQVIVCPEVWTDGLPILCVCRTRLSGLQFLCGKDHSEDGPEHAAFVLLVEVITRDSTVAAVATMNVGHIAFRDGLGGPWLPIDDTTYPSGKFETAEREDSARIDPFEMQPLRIAEVRKVLELIPALESRSPPFSVPPPYSKGAIFIGFHEECRELIELRDALYSANLVQAFDWGKWQDEAILHYEQPELVRTADLNTIIKLITTHVRKDRFCEGHLGSMLDDGHLQIVFRRLRDLFGDSTAA